MSNKRKRQPSTQPVDPRALIARLSQESQRLLEREIIAPLLPDGRIRTRLSGLIYEFKPRERFVGWGRFRPANEREAVPLGEAQPWERGSYLELFPLLRVILLWPETSGRYPGTWLAVPYNESDARQRFGLSMEPLPVFLCDPTDGAERFERVLTRMDGGTLWFEGPDVLADPTHAEWLRTASLPESDEALLPGLAASERQALLYWRLRQLELEQAENARSSEQTRPQGRQRRRARPGQQDNETSLRGNRGRHTWPGQQNHEISLREKLRHALAKADATLHSYSEVTASDGSLSQLIVEWSQRGQTLRYRSALDPRLTVVSSGICLSGRDRDFDLTSLVSVMTDAGSSRYFDDW